MFDRILLPLSASGAIMVKTVQGGFVNVCGERIRARRKELGMTQAQLAEKLYISNKAVSKWETGVSQT